MKKNISDFFFVVVVVVVKWDTLNDSGLGSLTKYPSDDYFSYNGSIM